MNTYSDNQTGHLFVVDSPDKVQVSPTVKHLFKMSFNHGNNDVETSDILDDRRILNIKVKPVSPVYYRKWTVEPLANITAKENTTYSLFFYLENMLGFGLQDRWDLAATYKTGSTAPASFSTVLGHLAFSLYGKLNVEGPIKNDFTITVGNTTIDSNAWKDYGSTRNLPNSMSNATSIIIAENPDSPTYSHNYLEILTNSHPYEYDLTLSTYEDHNNAIWNKDSKRRISAENNTDVGPRFTSGVIVKDMENFFMRNRADLYSLTPNFGVSIINKLRANKDANYSIVNVHYAFSDGLGFTYYSEKDLNIAVKEDSTGATTNGDAVAAVIAAKSNVVVSSDVTTINNAIGSMSGQISDLATTVENLDDRVTALEG